MKKYNLSAIMKRAWELVKKMRMSISSGLKKAWREAKNMCKELPELVGSPKQIAWAEDIRKKMIEYGNSCINFHEFKGRKKMPARMKKAMETIYKIKEAKWFIENRYCAYSPRELDVELNSDIDCENNICERKFKEALSDYEKKMEWK